MGIFDDVIVFELVKFIVICNYILKISTQDSQVAKEDY